MASSSSSKETVFLGQKGTLVDMLSQILESQSFKWNDQHNTFNMRNSSLMKTYIEELLADRDNDLAFKKPPRDISSLGEWKSIDINVLIAIYLFLTYISVEQFDSTYNQLISTFPDDFKLDMLLGDEYPDKTVTMKMVFSILHQSYFINTDPPDNFNILFLKANTSACLIFQQFSKHEGEVKSMKFDSANYVIINDDYYLAVDILLFITTLIKGWFNQIFEKWTINQDDFI